MRKISYVIFAMIVFASCKKDNTDNQDRQVFRCRSYTDEYSNPITSTHTSVTTTLTYDQEDRIIRSQNDKTVSEKFEYTYPDEHSYKIVIYQGGITNQNQFGWINSNHQLDSLVNMTNANDTTTIFRFTYNSSRKLIALTQYNDPKGVEYVAGQSKYEYDGAGNVTKYTDVFVTQYNTYDLSKPNTVSEVVPFTVVSPYLLTRQESHYADKTIVYLYEYTYDQSGRIVTQKAKNRDTDEYFLRTYTY